MSTLPYLAPEGTESGVISLGSSWGGYSAIKHLVIFGASYCDVGTASAKDQPRPTRANPLGVPFPGDTYAEPGRPNWVGHLISSPINKDKARLVYCYAVGGATTDGVKAQIRLRFLPEVGKKPKWAPWSAEDTLFCTWVGINDCAFGGDFAQQMSTLYLAQQDLYDAGARNFLFVNVPPMERAPGAVGHAKRENARRRQESSVDGFVSLDGILRAISVPVAVDHGLLLPAEPVRDRSLVMKSWNTKLAKQVRLLASSHTPEVTAIIFSAHEAFTRVLDDPVAHSFEEKDVDKNGGAIWVDHLHPTSMMHEIIAGGMAELLESVPSAEK